MPKFEFCLPTLGKNVPAGPEWLHEIKYDGYRLRVDRDGDRVWLITRGGYDWSKSSAELSAPGFVARPMNRSEVERKFRGNAGVRWSKEQTEANLKALWAIDQTSDLAARP
jgi:hypothetical protein